MIFAMDDECKITINTVITHGYGNPCFYALLRPRDEYQYPAFCFYDTNEDRSALVPKSGETQVDIEPMWGILYFEIDEDWRLDEEWEYQR